LAEAGEIVGAGIYQKGSHPLALRILRKGPNAAADKVSKNVIAGKRRYVRTVIHVTADD
jgi:hypothetical protein